MTKPVLEVKDLDVFFGTGDAQVAAVRGASFSINPCISFINLTAASVP